MSVRMVLVVGAIGFLSVSAVHALRDRPHQNPPVPPQMAGGAPTAALVGADGASPTASTGPTAIALHADRSGHFVVDAAVDGRSLSMMVDTGATLCALSEEDAARIGIRVGPGDYTSETRTANGTVRVAPVRIGAIRIGPITVRDVRAVIVPRGRLGTNLLGMSFLGKVRDFHIAGGTMMLRG